MILDIIQIILGILITLYIPGYLLSMILFKKTSTIERICLSIGLSIFIVVILSFVLTAISYAAEVKGITAYNVWFSLILVSLIFIIILIFQHKTNKQRKKISLRKIFGVLVFYSGKFHLYSLLNRIFGKQKVTILMYHRISKQEQKSILDSNVISTSKDKFEEQMKYLAENCNVITFDHLLECYKKNIALPKHTVIITFDDGYKDNYTHAYPILLKYKLPATIALTTGYIGSNKLFWWDKIAFVIKKTKVKHFRLAGLGSYSIESRNQKEHVIYKIQEKLKKLSETRKNGLIAQLAKKLDVKIPKVNNLFLTWNDVRKMSKNNISFSAHTVTHPILTRIPLNKARDEIVASKRKIEKETGQKVNVFTYPNGDKHDMSGGIQMILKKNGFVFALSTIYGSNSMNYDLLRLKRIGVQFDDDLKLFRIKVSGLGRFYEPIYSIFR